MRKKKMRLYLNKLIYTVVCIVLALWLIAVSIKICKTGGNEGMLRMMNVGKSVADAVMSAPIVPGVATTEYPSVGVYEKSYKDGLQTLYDLVEERYDLNPITFDILDKYSGNTLSYYDKAPNVFIDTYIAKASSMFAGCVERGVISGLVYDPDNSAVTQMNYAPDEVVAMGSRLRQKLDEIAQRERTEEFALLDEESVAGITLNETILEIYGIDSTNFYPYYCKVAKERTKTKDAVTRLNADGQYELGERFATIAADYGFRAGDMKLLALLLSQEMYIETLDNAIKLREAEKAAEEQAKQALEQRRKLRQQAREAGVVVGEERIYKGEPPYRYHEFSQETFIKAALSAVGNIRYVWAGGHNSGNIKGVSPLWRVFNNFYSASAYYNSSCIRPLRTKCPIHGNLGETESACAHKGGAVPNIPTFIEERSEYFEGLGYGRLYDVITDAELLTVFGEQYNTSHSAHRLDGLDCSGFASWLYNQVDDTHVYNSGAKNFIANSGMEQLPLDAELRTGDIAAWDTHIVVILGKWADNTYITIESVPNTVRLGVAYKNGGRDIDGARQFVSQINKRYYTLRNEKVIVHNLSKYIGREIQKPILKDGKQVAVAVHSTTELKLGRIKRDFIDATEAFRDSRKTIGELSIATVIETLMDEMATEEGESFYGTVSALEQYTGPLTEVEQTISEKGQVGLARGRDVILEDEGAADEALVVENALSVGEDAADYNDVGAEESSVIEYIYSDPQPVIRDRQVVEISEPEPTNKPVSMYAG